MQANLANGNCKIRRHRGGSFNFDFYQSRAIRRRTLVHRVIWRRYLTIVGRTVSMVCATTIGNLLATSWPRTRAKRAGIAAALLIFAFASETWAQSASTHHGTDNHSMALPSDLKWTDVPSLPPGAQIAVMEGPLSKPVPITARIKFPANYRLPAHHHPVIEHVTVISGTFHMGTGDKLDMTKTRALPPGGFAIMQPGTHHFAWTSEETIVQIHGVGPWGITYVNPAADPRKK